MNLTCPTCRTILQISDTYPDRRVHCSGCGGAIQVPRQRKSAAEEVWEVAAEDIFEDTDDAQEGLGIDQGVFIVEDTKTCPMCGETIKAIARKCRYCGEPLAGIAGPGGRPASGVWRDGNRLVMTKDAQLPFICIKTNKAAEGWLRRRMSWHHPLVYLTILGGLLIYVILALVVRETADIRIGLCHERFVRRRWTIAISWLGAILGVALFVIGVANTQPYNSAYLLSILGGLTFIGALFVWVIFGPVVTPARITSRYIWLKGVHPAFLASLPPFPGER